MSGLSSSLHADALNFAGRPYDARQLDSMLAIPEVHLAMSRASECNMPPGRLSELLAITSAAQATLLRAVATAREAQAAAGIPLTHRVKKFSLWRRHGQLAWIGHWNMISLADKQSSTSAVGCRQEARTHNFWPAFWSNYTFLMLPAGVLSPYPKGIGKLHTLISFLAVRGNDVQCLWPRLQVGERSQ